MTARVKGGSRLELRSHAYLPAFWLSCKKTLRPWGRSRSSSHGQTMQAECMEGPFPGLAAALRWHPVVCKCPLSPLLVSVIEGDIMSPDFIPSQPEGVFLYPFCIFFGQPWGRPGPTWWGWGFCTLPVCSFTWLQIQQISGA